MSREFTFAEENGAQFSGPSRKLSGEKWGDVEVAFPSTTNDYLTFNIYKLFSNAIR